MTKPCAKGYNWDFTVPATEVYGANTELMGFPGGSMGKESTCNEGDTDIETRLVDSVGEGEGEMNLRAAGKHKHYHMYNR